MILRVRDENGVWRDIPAIKGADGKTPVKGEDYFTEEEKQTLLDELYARIINGNEVMW